MSSDPGGPIARATLTPAERAAADAIDPAWLAAELAALCSVPSITGSEGAARDHVARLLASAGLAVDAWDADPVSLSADSAWPGSEMPRTVLPMVAGTWTGRRPGPRLLLVGHTDVVPPGEPATWSTPPFQPVVRDGFLVARGAADMKGGLVAALAAIRAVAGTLHRARAAGEVVLLGVPSEEDGGGGMLAAIRAGYTGTAAVIPEPTALRIVVAHAGAITFRLDVPGRAAHASTRTEGVSALEKLEVLHAALRADEAARNAAETRPVMSSLGLPYPTILGTVRGGDWASTVPDRMVADGRYGVRLGQSPADAEAELRAAISAACDADEWLRVHPAGVDVWGARFASAEVAASEHLPMTLGDIAAAVRGDRPPAVGVPYGADMALLVNVGATPTVLFGPGDVRVAHAADEHVSLAEVTACARVLAAWLVRELTAAD